MEKQEAIKYLEDLFRHELILQDGSDGKSITPNNQNFKLLVTVNKAYIDPDEKLPTPGCRVAIGPGNHNSYLFHLHS